MNNTDTNTSANTKISASIARNAKDGINVLGMTLRRDGLVAVSYEFPYRAGRVERRWCKQVELVPETVSQGMLYDLIYERVKEIKANIEF